MVPTGEPLQVNTHYYAIFSRAQPPDIPYAHMRRQISVIKGCKVDLQLGPEYRTLGHASTNSVPGGRSGRGSYQFIRDVWNPRLRWLRCAMMRVLRSRIPSVRAQIPAYSIECCCVVYDPRGDGNTGNKIATMEMSDAAEKRRNYGGSLRWMQQWNPWNDGGNYRPTINLYKVLTKPGQLSDAYYIELLQRQLILLNSCAIILF